MMKSIVCFAFFCFVNNAFGAIVEKEITYRDGATEMKGFLAYDSRAVANGRKVPGVMIIHQWMGLTEYEKRRARMLAELGYVAFAADIYGVTVRPKDTQEAGQAAGKFRSDPSLFRKRLALGLTALSEQPEVDNNRLAAIGYCFGGTGALELARDGAKVKAVVSFHGGLGTTHPDGAKNIRGSVLVCHGQADPLVSAEEISKFKSAMDSAKVDYVFIGYSGAKHSFTQPSAGNDPNSASAYDAKADLRSWEAMRDFLSEVFGS